MDTITLASLGRRRRYSAEFKAQSVQTCLRPGTSVAAIARLHNINDNMVHRWIREVEHDASALTSGVAIPAGAESNMIGARTTAPCVPVQESAAWPERIPLERVKNGLNVRLDGPATESASCAQARMRLLR